MIAGIEGEHLDVACSLEGLACLHVAAVRVEGAARIEAVHLDATVVARIEGAARYPIEAPAVRTPTSRSRPAQCCGMRLAGLRPTAPPPSPVHQLFDTWRCRPARATVMT